MPGRAGGQLALLEQHDVGLVVARQMIGRRAADDAAADDDDLGMRGQGHDRVFPYVRAIGVERRVEPRQVFRGVGDVVDAGRVEMQLGDHAPHRLAQQRGALHGGVRAADLGARRRAEIGGEQFVGFVGRHAGVGGDAGEVEHRRVEAGIFEVDQPQPLAVVEEVGRQQIVVAEDDRQRLLRLLQLVGEREIAGQFACVMRLLPACQRARIVADDVERPRT